MKIGFLHGDTGKNYLFSATDIADHPRLIKPKEMLSRAQVNETLTRTMNDSFLEKIRVAGNISKKNRFTLGRIPCSLCVRRSRRIERELTFWVCGLVVGAGGQGSMPPGRTKCNGELRRYVTQKGSPDAKRFSGRNPIGW